MRKAKVYMQKELAGYLTETDDGYEFSYDTNYLAGIDSQTSEFDASFTRRQLTLVKLCFPFLMGLIPEGWLLEIAENNWKLNARDRMGLLLLAARIALVQ